METHLGPKYGLFKEHPRVLQHSRFESKGERWYVPIECPHCTQIFTRIPEEAMKANKAGKCKQHLATCSAYVPAYTPKSESDHYLRGKYDLFKEHPRVFEQSRFESKGERWYIPIECPHCTQIFTRVPEEAMKTNKAGKCKQHLATCSAYLRADTSKPSPKRHKASSSTKGDEIVTIYALIYLPTGARVYTGRTKDPDRRLAQHAAKGSKCRLVRNAFRKYGRKSFGLEPILRCRASDADANESFWIIENKTLYPDGYNLRHGSKAGEEDDDSLATALVPMCTGVIPFTDFADEALARAEGWTDVAEMAGGLESSTNEADELCKDFLRQVHPDAHGGETRAYSADEVAAMLNAVREAVA